jgi:hypothetical protein
VTDRQTRPRTLDDVFDFTDDDVDGTVEVPTPAAERRLATGTIPRLDLGAERAEPALEPPDSARATTRMTVEEVLELRGVTLEARQRQATQPFDDSPEPEPLPPIPIAGRALPHLLPVRASWSKRLQRWLAAERLRLALRRFEPRDIVVAFAAGVLIGLLAAW